MEENTNRDFNLPEERGANEPPLSNEPPASNEPSLPNESANFSSPSPDRAYPPQGNPASSRQASYIPYNPYTAPTVAPPTAPPSAAAYNVPTAPPVYYPPASSSPYGYTAEGRPQAERKNRRSSMSVMLWIVSIAAIFMCLTISTSVIVVTSKLVGAINSVFYSGDWENRDRDFGYDFGGESDGSNDGYDNEGGTFGEGGSSTPSTSSGVGLGITAYALDADTVAGFAIDGGVVIASIDENSSFTGTTVRANDIIVKVDGKSVASVADVQAVFSGKAPGDSVTLTIVRFIDGSPESSEVTVKLVPIGG